MAGFEVIPEVNCQLSLSTNRIPTAVKLANRQVWRRSEQSMRERSAAVSDAESIFRDQHEAHDYEYVYV